MDEVHPRQLKIADFNYDLPADRIAFFPLEKRDASKLLIYRNGNLRETVYAGIPGEIPAGSTLVFNNTRVVEARMFFEIKEGSKPIEIFCLAPHGQYTDMQQALQQTGEVYWQCLIGGASRWKNGGKLSLHVSNAHEPLTLYATITEKKEDSYIVHFSWEPAQLHFADVLEKAGALPLPPYIKRKADVADKERYQTTYAHIKGSVAAPTAGLHFTPELLEALSNKEISTGFLTLHVGAGTFKPVKAGVMENHIMHSEVFEVDIALLQLLISTGLKNIIAVGTTSLRTLESLYWMGVKLLQGQSKWNYIQQWEVYELAADIDPLDALKALYAALKDTKKLYGTTQIIIAPGYRLKVASALITNFHQPQSTLLLLVAALCGDNWKKIYNYALNNHFRFLSYGDGCFIWPDDIPQYH